MEDIIDIILKGNREEPKQKIKGRVAKCTHCGKEVKSDENLPFFEKRENEDHDVYYCGCWGWE